MEEKILEIRNVHKDYGYRRIHAELRNQGYCINKKKVQRIIQKLKLQVTSFTYKCYYKSVHFREFKNVQN